MGKIAKIKKNKRYLRWLDKYLYGEVKTSEKEIHEHAKIMYKQNKGYSLTPKEYFSPFGGEWIKTVYYWAKMLDK